MRNGCLVLWLLLISFQVCSQRVALDGSNYLVHRVWMYNDRERKCEVKAPKELYNYYQRERGHNFYRYELEGKLIGDNRNSFVFSEKGKPVIRDLARKLETLAFSEIEKVEVALSYVQTLPYSYDSTSKRVDEYVRYPVETLVDGCGDCEDKSLLLAAILHEMNIGFVLLMTSDHMAVGVNCEPHNGTKGFLFNGKKYYYAETTETDYDIGQVPDNMVLAQLEVLPGDATPVLIVNDVKFESQPVKVIEKAPCVLEMALRNLGPGKINGLQIHLTLVAQNKRGEQVLAEEYRQLADLPECLQRTEKILFKSMIKENSVLRVEFSGANIADQSYEYDMKYSRSRRY